MPSKKSKRRDRFYSIFYDNTGIREALETENINDLSNDFSISPYNVLQNIKKNHVSLLLTLWSQEKYNKQGKSYRQAYSAGPNMQQVNSFELLKYMTGTWKKNATAMKKPMRFDFEKNTSNVTFETNNYRLLTPELLGYDTEGNWKNKKATLVVQLSEYTLKLLQSRRLPLGATIKYNTDYNKWEYKQILKSNKTIQEILSDNKVPSIWMDNIYKERYTDNIDSQTFFNSLYRDYKSAFENFFVGNQSMQWEDIIKYAYNDVNNANKIQNLFTNNELYSPQLEIKIRFNLHSYFKYKKKHNEYKSIFSDASNYEIGDVILYEGKYVVLSENYIAKSNVVRGDNVEKKYYDYDLVNIPNKDSFFKITFEENQAYLETLSGENKRFGVLNELNTDYKKIPINMFNLLYYINYVFNKTDTVDDIFIQQSVVDLPHVELSELTWSNIGNIFADESDASSIKEKLYKPIGSTSDQNKTVSTKNIFVLQEDGGEFETFTKLIDSEMSICIQGNNVYPLERKLNLKYGCLIPMTLTKSIFNKSSLTFKKNIEKILSAKKTPLSKIYNQIPVWVEKAKQQILKYLLRRRQKALLKDINGYIKWNRIEKNKDVDKYLIYKYNVIDYKGEYFRLNQRDRYNFEWGKSIQIFNYKENVLYFRYDIVEFENFYYQLVQETNYNAILTNEDYWQKIEITGDLRSFCRPVGYGIFNKAREIAIINRDANGKFDEHDNTEDGREALLKKYREGLLFAYEPNPDETPIQNVSRKVVDQMRNNVDVMNYIDNNNKTKWKQLNEDLNSSEISDVRASVKNVDIRNRNFVRCYEDINFKKNIKKLWSIDHYSPSVYLIDHFEYLRGNSNIKRREEEEFYLNKKNLVKTLTEAKNVIKGRILNPDDAANQFKLEIRYNFTDETTYDTEEIKMKWWDAWYTEYIHKLELFKGEYTEIELEFLNYN